MMEIFQTYKRREPAYLIFTTVVALSWVFVPLAVFIPEIKHAISPELGICVFLIWFGGTLFGMFLGATNIETFIEDGSFGISETGLSINEQSFILEDILLVEVSVYSYKGGGGKGGISDGTGNKVYIKAKDNVIFEGKFVISSKEQRDSAVLIFKGWKMKGFKIISNGFDLI